MLAALGTARVRGAVSHARHLREMRRRRPHPVRFDPHHTGQPTVYYLCPDDDTPRGGIRNIYRHVDVLTTVGIPAAVVHGRAGFRCTWFANSTRVVTAQATVLGPADILVVPEYNMPMIGEVPAPVRKVIFNQNAYQTFQHIPLTEAGEAPYVDTPNLRAILTVSRDNAELLSYTFPGLPVGLARLVIDGDVFHPLPAQAPRDRRIAYLPRRRSEEQHELLHILRSRGTLAGWTLQPIDGRTEQETAAAMRECPLFLSFSEREGFGLPPAEAMASGAYVIGYTGLAGRDYFDPADCTPVGESDLLAFARAVDDVVERYEKDPEPVHEAGRRASQRVLSTYTVEGLAEDLRGFYQSLAQEQP